MKSVENSKAVLETAALSVPAKSYSFRLCLSLALSVIVCYCQYMGGLSVGIFILALLTLLFCADVVFQNAWKDIERGIFSVSVLATVAIVAAFGYSISKTFLVRSLAGPVNDLYIVQCGVIIFYLWMARRDALSKEHTQVFIKKLDDFLPKSGRLRQGQREMMAFARELKEGDIIRVKAGETIPCEGVIAKGETAIDESLITGNMLPTKKTEGGKVYAGTVNKGDSIFVRVEKPLSKSVIAGIIRAIKNSERRRCLRKNPLDQYAWGALVCMLLVAVAGYVEAYWSSNYTRPLHSLGILLLAAGLGCPWAFFLASALPIWAVRTGARRRNIELQALGALEVFEQADVVFFDKTGTLTYGELRVSSIHPVSDKTQKELMMCLASAEQMVDGPFAAAIMIYAQEQKLSLLPLRCFDVLPGLGVKAIAKRNTILAGRPEWLIEQGIDIPKIPQGDLPVVCGAKNGKYLGYVLLDDKLRRGAAEMIQTLKAAGKEIILMSGDNESSVRTIAQEAGIEKFNFGVLPQTKAEILGNYAALGKRTVMIGDGFNDITALLRADAGIVFSSGKNVYNNWVDIIIHRADLHSISDILHIDSRLRRCTLTNVILSIFCNVLLMGGLLLAPEQFWDKWYMLPLGLAGGIVLVFLNSVRLLHIK